MQCFKINNLRSLCQNHRNSPDLFMSITGTGFIHIRASADRHTLGKLHQCDLFSKAFNRFIERRHVLTQITPLKQRRIEKIVEGQILTVAATTRILAELEGNPLLHRLHILEQELINSICLSKQYLQDCRESLISRMHNLCDGYKNILTSMQSANEAEQSLVSYLDNFSSYIRVLTAITPPPTPTQQEALKLLEMLIQQQIQNARERLTEGIGNKQEQPAREAAVCSPVLASATGTATGRSDGQGTGQKEEHQRQRDSHHQSFSVADGTRPPSQPFRRLKGVPAEFGGRMLWDGRKLRRYLQRLPTHSQLTQRVLDSMHNHPGMMELIARLAPHQLAHDALLAQQIRAAAVYLGVESDDERFYLKPDELAWLILNGCLHYEDAGRVLGKPTHLLLCQEAIRLRRIIDNHRRHSWY